MRSEGHTHEDFEALSHAMMVAMVHQATGTGEREVVSSDGTTSTVNVGHDTIPFHREGSYAPGGPDILLLFCQTPAVEGGQTTLCDGTRLLEVLPPEVRDYVERTTLRWTWDAPPERWQAHLRTTSKAEARLLLDKLATILPASDRLEASFVDGDVLRGQYYTPCVVRSKLGGQLTFSNSLLIYHYREGSSYFAKDLFGVSLEDGSPFPIEILREIDACAAAIRYEHDWATGDLLAIDNWRMMHGRLAFSDPRRRVLIRMGHLAKAGGEAPAARDAGR